MLYIMFQANLTYPCFTIGRHMDVAILTHFHKKKAEIHEYGIKAILINDFFVFLSSFNNITFVNYSFLPAL
jgi:hypothetical protein